MAVNFAPNDLVVTLTYSAAALPATAEIARDRHLKPFIRKLREYFRGYGEQLKYMYVTEGLHGDKRLHHHIIVPDVLDVRDIVCDLWQRNGQNVGFEYIGSHGYEAWAGYLTKEPRKTGRRFMSQRMWTPSLGLKKPDVSKYEVPDDYIYEPPAGVVITHNEPLQTEWFPCQFVSYFDPHYWSKK